LAERFERTESWIKTNVPEAFALLSENGYENIARCAAKGKPGTPSEYHFFGLATVLKQLGQLEGPARHDLHARAAELVAPFKREPSQRSRTLKAKRPVGLPNPTAKARKGVKRIIAKLRAEATPEQRVAAIAAALSDLEAERVEALREAERQTAAAKELLGLADPPAASPENRFVIPEALIDTQGEGRDDFRKTEVMASPIRLNPTSEGQRVRAMLSLSSIPDELRKLPQWVCWKYLERDGKLSKPPINALTGRLAKVDQDSTGSTFDEAFERWTDDDTLAGLGLVMTKGTGFVGLDFDDVIDSTGVLNETVATWVNRLDTYTEVSPSGRGIRVFLQGEIPPSVQDGNRKQVLGFGVEVYGGGSPRYLTVTGAALRGFTSIEARQTELVSVLSDIDTLTRQTKTDKTRPLAQTPVSGRHRLPSYEMAAARSGSDRSAADLRYAMTALGWGHSAAVVEEALLLESPKAKERKDGARYVARTVEKAAQYMGAR
jgi:hypothetical protein